MRKRKLGRTGHHVSELGIGTLGLADDQWRGLDPKDAQRTLYAALELGVDFIDTALSYGDGLAEKLIGEVVRDLRARDRVVVATKVPPMDGRWPARPEVPLERVFHPDHVQHSVEQSLRNLRADALVIAQLHVWHDAWLASPVWPEVRGRMQQMIVQGKVLHWGVSSNSCDPASALQVLDESIIETVQVVYNIFERRCEAKLFDKARACEVGVIVRSPLDEGVLSGRFTRETRFPEGDFRTRYFTSERLSEMLPRIQALGALCGDEVASLPELGLRFALQHPDVGVVIPGMRRIEHLRQNLAAAAAGALSKQLYERLREHAWEKNWYQSANQTSR